ncbi:hypothetical protein J2X97_000315 [Epilithonimonas hungarica]|uniref:hypothetical protein n=1 Tax=Epilithonimonas hungarica TaxID=454006 RepID=UPI0027861887|nr:hypothetical protein [Epilithonimonas hungarica]MDP9954678.1 hypothetical protein [Epilithonimonas hungarica]
MHTKFKLIGLAKSKQKFTLETKDNQEIFWSHESHLSEKQYSALFDLAKNTDGIWKGNNYCIIEHDAEHIYSDEVPKNPKVIKVIMDI